MPAGTIDVQVNDVDVTQAIYPFRAYTPVDQPAPGVRSRLFGAGSGEIALRREGRTVVRVYATLRAGPAGGLASVPATLEGFALGRSLGTISPEAGPAVVTVGSSMVDTAQRTYSAGAYTFVLPNSWTKNATLDLTARVNPAGAGCDADCLRRATFRLTGISFRRTANSCGRFECTGDGVVISPVALTINGRRAATEPNGIFAFARASTPIEILPYGWLGDIEIGDLTSATPLSFDSCFL